MVRALTREILFLLLEHKIHIFELTCNVRFIKDTDDGGVFDDFPKISDHFLKISEDSLKLVRGSHERCRTFSKDCRRLAKKTQRCFDDTPTNFRTI